MGMEGKRTFPLPSGALAETPVIRQINKRKTNRSLLTCVPHVYMGDTQGKGRKLPRWLRIQNYIPF